MFLCTFLYSVCISGVIIKLQKMVWTNYDTYRHIANQSHVKATMSSNISIQRICEFCGNEFTARTTVTKYCQHRCASMAYKARTRNSNIKRSNFETAKSVSIPIAAVQAKDFLKVEEVCGLLGISRSTVSRAIKENRLRAIRFGRRIIIKRTDIDGLFS